RTPLSSALETSSSRRRGPAISSEARAKRSKNFTAGAVAETPGATQSITTLASTTGIELARTFAAIRQDKITGRLAGRGTPQDLVGGSAPFGQRERLGLLAAGQCLHVTAQHEEPLTQLSRSKPSGPDPTAYGLCGSSRESRGSPDIQFVACHVSHAYILLH